MTGEIVDSRTVWQGGPATMWFRYLDPDVVAAYKPPDAGQLRKGSVEMKMIPDV